MPRINHVEKARKDQGACGKCGEPIIAGSPYNHISFRYGGKRKRHATKECQFRASDLTQSKMSAVYAAQESLEDYLADWADTVVDGLRGECEEAASEVRCVAEEYAEAADAMGDAGADHQEKADELEAFADVLENVDLEDFDEDAEYDDKEQAESDWRDDCISAVEDALSNCPSF